MLLCFVLRFDAVAIQEYIKKRQLIEKLQGKRELIAKKHAEEIYPLLNGTKYHILLIFYWAVEKLCTDLPVAQEIQTHRTLLKNIMKFAPGIFFLL